MKKLELNPSDYTTDEIYTAFESLNSAIGDIYLEKLEQLNKMYKLIEKNLRDIGAPYQCVFQTDGLKVIWDKEEKRLFIWDGVTTYGILSAPREYKIMAEKMMPSLIKGIAREIEEGMK